jgi:ABC-type branched-subunit amino acid transport system substrate-binding protein
LYHYYLQIDINTFKRSDWPKLEGILAVVPVIDNERASGINETLQKEAFDIWRNSPKDKDSFPEDLSTVSPYAMYTFDAAWALIQALNKSSFDKNSPSMEQSPHCFDSLLKNYSNYHMYLKSTRFSGVSGIIQFSKNNSNDRVDGASYGLYNMQQKQQKNNITKRKLGYKQVMTWYETSRSWKSSTGEDTINIIWPGGEFEKVPTDYPQLRG